MNLVKRFIFLKLKIWESLGKFILPNSIANKYWIPIYKAVIVIIFL